METETAGLVLSQSEIIIAAALFILGTAERIITFFRERNTKEEKLTAEAAFEMGEYSLGAVIAGIEHAERMAAAGLISNSEMIPAIKLEIEKISNYVGAEKGNLAPAVQTIAEAVGDLWEEKPSDASRLARSDIATKIRQNKREPIEALPDTKLNEIAAKRGKSFVFFSLFAALLLIPLSGCQLLEPSLRQQADFTSYEYNQKLTPELAAQVDDLQVTTTVIETLDPETGKVISRRTVQDKTRGLPVVPGTTKILASEDFADTDRQITSTRDSIGSNLQINQTNAGNADTLNPAVQGQVARGAQQADFADKALSTLTRGVVDINRDNRQADVDKTKIEATRDVELAKFSVEEEEEHGEGEHAPEEAAVEPVTEELPATD